MDSQTFFGELRWGSPTPCGETLISASDVVAFGRMYDPLPFHVDETAAAGSFFGGLVASGAHIASAASAQARSALHEAAVVGSPGVELLELLRPVPAGTVARVVHTFVRPREHEHWMGAPVRGCALAECRTEAFDAGGVLLMRCTELQWIRHAPALGPRGLGHASDVAFAAGFPRHPRPASSGSSGTCLEDCREGKWFGSGPKAVRSEDMADFARRFGSTGDSSNDWQGFSYAVGLTVDAMWRHGHPVAGAAVDRVRWGARLHPDQELYCDVLVRNARPSRSRPDLGVIETTVFCSDTHGHLICQFDLTSLLQKRH